MPTRVCRRCGEELDLEAGFYKSPCSKGGRNTLCKGCVYKRRLGDPRYHKVFTCACCGVEYQRNGRYGSMSLCVDCAAKGKVCRRCKQFKPLDRFSPTGDGASYCSDGCFQLAWRERRYGVAAGTGDVVFAQFPNHCGICGATESTGPQKSLVVDHCHAAGTIRGMLCRQCNLALGLLKDDPKLLEAAINYLQKPRDAAAA